MYFTTETCAVSSGTSSPVTGWVFAVLPSHRVTGFPWSSSIGSVASHAKTASRHSIFRKFPMTGSGGMTEPRVRKCHCRYPIHSTSSAMLAARALTSKPSNCCGETVDTGQVQENLALSQAVQHVQHFAFQTLQMFQGDIQEIARSTGWIKHPDRTQPLVKLFNLLDRCCLFPLAGQGEGCCLHG